MVEIYYMNKEFLTYNQQMKALRERKNIDCEGSSDKQILIRSGYFNIINGYKTPFVASTSDDNIHTYIKNTSLQQIKSVKIFDEKLKYLLLMHITTIEEEVRTLAAHKFDLINNKGKIPWHDITAYRSIKSMDNFISTMSSIYQELKRSKLGYVKFYQEKYQSIPTWIIIKIINFNTFINFLNICKTDVTHALCELYDLKDEQGKPNIKLLIGSLHWMRKVRNACAHNERIYSMIDSSDRINEKYILYCLR